jgi:hypothetical protein
MVTLYVNLRKRCCLNSIRTLGPGAVEDRQGEEQTGYDAIRFGPSGRGHGDDGKQVTGMHHVRALAPGRD